MEQKIRLMADALHGEHGAILDAARQLAASLSHGVTVSGQENTVLESLFNRLNGNAQHFSYPYTKLARGEQIPYPSADAQNRNPTDLMDKLRVFADVRSLADVNAMLDTLERYAAYAPDPEAGEGMRDISLFDARKMSCAIASCLYDAMQAKCISGTESAEMLAVQDLFLLYSFDTSGIQKFIYTIISKHALKALRARSFYLEMLMESIVNELLTRAGLSRANLIYAGGGHAFVLLPNVPSVHTMLQGFKDELHAWLLETFRSEVYVADGSCICSANALSNLPEGSYREIFRTISAQLSEKKLHRYNAAEILQLNRPLAQHERECRVCHRSDLLGSGDRCRICGALEEISPQIRKAAYFSLTKTAKQPALVMPFGRYLQAHPDYPRDLPEDAAVFGKNATPENGEHSVRLWLGDYANADSMQELCQNAKGIKRLGVLRADVDNLGQAFVSGFPAEKTTLTRTAAFSRNLSQFFKLHMNDILRNGRFHLDGSEEIRPRNAAIIYAGGDDLFVVGGWDDVLGFAVDLYRDLRSFTQDTLHISAGLGVYPEKYPIAAMARETGDLEECSKQAHGKNAITLFDESNRYSWDVLAEQVIGQKMTLLRNFLQEHPERGNSMLYNMLSLLRELDAGNRLNIARFAYLLARMRPENSGKTDYPERLERYQTLADQLYQWARMDDDRVQLMTAIQLYVYLTRSEEGDRNGQ